MRMEWALPHSADGWRIKLRVNDTQKRAVLCLGHGKKAPIRLMVRPDGGLKMTHGRSERFLPPPEKNLANFAALNIERFLSSVIVPCRSGTGYTLDVRPTSCGRYSVWVYTPENPRGTEFARDYFPAPDAADIVPDVLWLELDVPGAVEIEQVEAAPPLPEERPHAPAVYHVGPSRGIKDLQQAAWLVRPGDMVLVDADYRHTGALALPYSGLPGLPIVYKGLGTAQKRPVIDGAFDIYAVEASGHYTVLEGFEICNAAKAGVCHHAHRLEIRDCVIHDCLMGILSDQDIGMGDCEVERCEVYGCGHEMHSHQLYMATDEARFPGSVVKVHDCFIHDSLGGNNIKSRARRNEIYHNRIVNAYYHNLELIGPDPEFNRAPGEQAAHNSDIWDNYFENSRWYQFRCGGDGTGDSNGTFRFVNNTVVSDFVAREEELRVFRLMFGIRRIEAYGNRFVSRGEPSSDMVREIRTRWVDGDASENRLPGLENENSMVGGESPAERGEK